MTHVGHGDSRNSITDVVGRDDRRASLEAIRDRLAVELDEAHGRDVAPIAKQLADVIREIDSLPTPSGASAVEKIRRRLDRGEDPADM